VRKTPNSSLTIVEPPTFTPIAPPRKLGEAGQALWDAVQNEFRIEDCGGVELLMQACLAADRAEALAARIDRDGETIHNVAEGPTKGRVLDHIGFDVKDLKAFIAKLEAAGVKLDADGGYRVNDVDVGIAFITDPWGTRIELNERPKAVYLP
jgi:hypothetical protein